MTSRMQNLVVREKQRTVYQRWGNRDTWIHEGTSSPTYNEVKRDPVSTSSTYLAGAVQGECEDPASDAAAPVDPCRSDHQRSRIDRSAAGAPGPATRLGTHRTVITRQSISIARFKPAHSMSQLHRAALDVTVASSSTSSLTGPDGW